MLVPFPNQRTRYKISRAANPRTPAAPGPADAITPVAAPPEEVDVAAPALEGLAPEPPAVPKDAEIELSGPLLVVEDPNADTETPDIL